VRLFQRLFKGRGGGRSSVACYLRENGPIAYELDLFTENPRERVEAMLSSGLEWSWHTPSREWTELTRVSLSAFLADVASGEIVLAGTEGDAPHHTLNSATIKDWIKRFSRLQPSPLVALISVRSGKQLLYVQQHASDTVNRLLDAWGLDKGSAERRSYARLGPVSLESLAEHL
jgi:hypothetical protein